MIDSLTLSIIAKYIRNYDGNTITVNIADYTLIIGKSISIRVNDIDMYYIQRKNAVIIYISLVGP